MTLAPCTEDPARAASLDYLERIRGVPRADRIAVVDRDGMRWCEKPATCRRSSSCTGSGSRRRPTRSRPRPRWSRSWWPEISPAPASTAPALPSRCLIVDHDDAEREHAYGGEALTNPAAEPIAETAARPGWMTISLRDGWSRVVA
jgi:hypothetical protein